jgi:hypothetical protein
LIRGLVVLLILNFLPPQPIPGDKLLNGAAFTADFNYGNPTASRGSRYPTAGTIAHSAREWNGISRMKRKFFSME